MGNNTRIANKSYLRQEESTLVCSSRVAQSIVVGKARQQGAWGSWSTVFTNRKQKTTYEGARLTYFFFSFHSVWDSYWWDNANHIQDRSSLFYWAPLEKPSQTHAVVCLPGDFKSSLVNSEIYPPEPANLGLLPLNTDSFRWSKCARSKCLSLWKELQLEAKRFVHCVYCRFAWGEASACGWREQCAEHEGD